MNVLRRRTAAHTRAVLLTSLLALGASAGCEEEEASVDSSAQGDGGSKQVGKSDGGADDKSASGSCSTTYQAIQKSIFEAKKCTSGPCHGAGNDTGLTLTADKSYENLINVDAKAPLTPSMKLVTPGEQALSFLYLKLAAATHKTPLPSGGGAPMPTGATPLSEQQLEAVRLWIRGGAPKTGVVAGTQELLDCSQPAEATPNKSARPEIPSPEVGFQHASGPWNVKPNSEDEVCFATYYDLTTSAPESAVVDCTIGGIAQKCVTYNRRELSQDAQSHHSIISVYGGAVAPTDAVWGQWRCSGGELEGTSCDPTKLGVPAKQGGADCGEKSVCQTEPKAGTCGAGFGPADKEMQPRKTVSAGGSQAPVSADRFPAGVFAQIPIKGLVLWNSHGFNQTNQSADIEQYNTFWYAKPEDRKFRMNGIFSPGKGGIPGALINVMPFQDQEICQVFTLPKNSRLIELSAHVHKRSLEWRTWLPPQQPTCDGGCKPSSEEPVYRSTSYNDPVVLPFDPPLKFDQDDEASRTLLFCSRYDNGKSDPKLLKQKSKLITGSDCVSVYPPREEELFCIGGSKHKERCKTDADCGGGSCDACPVQWGERTEDEMFFLMGQYYIEGAGALGEPTGGPGALR